MRIYIYIHIHICIYGSFCIWSLDRGSHALGPKVGILSVLGAPENLLDPCETDAYWKGLNTGQQHGPTWFLFEDS